MAAHKINYTNIKDCLEKHLVFAAYSLAGDTHFNLIISLKQEAKVLHSLANLDHSKGFVLHPFSTKSTPSLFIEPDYYFKEGDQHTNEIDHLEKIKIAAQNTDLESTSIEDYTNSFNQFIGAIHKGDFPKLVLSRIQSIDKEDDNLEDLFKSLNLNYVQNFNYILYTPQSGCWLGSSPEILYQEIGKQAKTVALAGTQKKQADITDYQWGEKEIQEQDFVVKYIKNILHTHVNDDFKESKSTAIAANLVHLKTSFHFDKSLLKNKSTLIDKLHPTPAVCGLPKEKAQVFIEESEAHDRSYYSGFLGPVNFESQSNLFVNLRCLKVDDTHFHLFVGGGITKDSELESEWHETELKAQTLLAIINKYKNGLFKKRN